MKIELRKLTVSDGPDIYDMLHEIGPGENGFINDGFVELAEYPAFLQMYVNYSKGIELPADQVAQSMYWLYVDDKPVGYGKLRHYLNDRLRDIGGHIGYAIRPSERGKGYGTLMLAQILIKVREKGIDDVLMTCLEQNIGSRKVIENNNGVLKRVTEGECYYGIKLGVE